VAAVLQEGKASAKAATNAIASSDALNKPTSVHEPIEKLPSAAQLGESRDEDAAASDVGMKSGKH
jgi:hypothetical protein